MRYLPTEFLEECQRNGRTVWYAMFFTFPSTGIVFASDRPHDDFNYFYGLPGSKPVGYHQIVEDWGTVEDTSQLQGLIDGTASGGRQMTVTLSNRGEFPFSRYFLTDPPENVKVNVHIWLPEADGINHYDDVGFFVIQDPIRYTEAGKLLQLDLVSVNQTSDPIIGRLSPTSNDFYGIVLGTISNAAGSTYGTRPVVQLNGDLNNTATTVPCTSDPVAAGFPSSGYFVLDYEVIQYTGTTSNSFTGCTRGKYTPTWSAAMPHANGQKIFKYNHEYLYSFGQGPVDSAGPVRVNGIVYTGQHTIYADRNPVQVGFLHGDPFAKAVSSTTITKNTDNFNLGNYVGYLQTNTWYNTNNSAIQADDGTYCYMVGNNYYWGNGNVNCAQFGVQGWGISTGIAYHAEFVSGKVLANGYQDGTSSYVVKEKIRLYAKYAGGSWRDPDEKTEGSSGADFNLAVDLTEDGWTGAVAGYYTELMSLCASDMQTWITRPFCKLDLLRAEIKYKPYIKSYSTTVTCGLSSGTGNTNPADAIYMVLGRMGIAGQVDTTKLNEAKTWYTTNGYSFNGWIPGEMRCSEVLAAMLQQCRSRLNYTHYHIDLIVRDNLADTGTDKVFTQDSTRTNSIDIARQPVREICNKLTLRYNCSAIDVYDSTVEVSDTDSITRYGLHDQVWDFNLVTSSTMAADLAAFYLEEMARPYTYLTFAAYLEGMQVECEDGVVLLTDFDNLGAFKGLVSQSSWTLGSSKAQRINSIKLTLRGYMEQALEMNVTEEATPSEVFADIGLQADLADTATPTESTTNAMETTDQDGYGQGGYGQGGYGL